MTVEVSAQGPEQLIESTAQSVQDEKRGKPRADSGLSDEANKEKMDSSNLEAISIDSKCSGLLDIDGEMDDSPENASSLLKKDKKQKKNMSGETGWDWNEHKQRMRVTVGDTESMIASKKISYILRHGQRSLDIPVDKDGWIKGTDLLSYMTEPFDPKDIQTLLAFLRESNEDKIRYEIRGEDSIMEVRANRKPAEKKTSKAKKTKGQDSNDEGNSGEKNSGSTREVKKKKKKDSEKKKELASGANSTSSKLRPESADVSAKKKKKNGSVAPAKQPVPSALTSEKSESVFANEDAAVELTPKVSLEDVSSTSQSQAIIKEFAEDTVAVAQVVPPKETLLTDSNTVKETLSPADCGSSPAGEALLSKSAALSVTPAPVDEETEESKKLKAVTKAKKKVAKAKVVGSKPIDENLFFKKYGLDDLARKKLHELSEEKQQEAMRKFNPVKSIQAEDYPKVFMTYIKKFKLEEDAISSGAAGNAFLLGRGHHPGGPGSNMAMFRASGGASNGGAGQGPNSNQVPNAGMMGRTEWRPGMPFVPQTEVDGSTPPSSMDAMGYRNTAGSQAGYGSAPIYYYYGNQLYVAPGVAPSQQQPTSPRYRRSPGSTSSPSITPGTTLYVDAHGNVIPTAPGATTYTDGSQYYVIPGAYHQQSSHAALQNIIAAPNSPGITGTPTLRPSPPAGMGPSTGYLGASAPAPQHHVGAGASHHAASHHSQQYAPAGAHAAGGGGGGGRNVYANKNKVSQNYNYYRAGNAHYKS